MKLHVLLVGAILLAQASEPGKVEEPLTFPTFEPFLASRMSKLAGLGAEKSTEQRVAEIRATLTRLGSMAPMLSDEEKKRMDDSARREHEEGEKPIALLGPYLSLDTKSWLFLVPTFVDYLEPLWAKAEWSETETELASLTAQYFARDPLGVKVEFAKGAHEANRRALEEVVRWFHGLAASPRHLAGMIFTMDNGPYAGIPLDTGALEHPVATKRLNEHVEVRLFELPDREEPFAVQGYVDGKLRWTRVISDSPDETVVDAAFLDQPPEDLGTYGWQIHMSVSYEGGAEYAPLYVGAQGEFLFYFMSW